ncbi:MAG: undecaprenyldiphospho-muramoylpentapeptide beta-N-acetylglucosaminyltransferase [Bacteroidales bacterium]
MNNNLQQHKYRFIISGGGTGGHIFPAISIAHALKSITRNAEILFVGAKGRMEMEKVPAAGYTIKGLWISGIQRKISTQNLLFPFKLISSLIKATRIIKNFKPDAVVGTGGYASGPTLRIACWKNIPCVIQEQNSFPGITNRLLAKRVQKICVAHENMQRYFPAEKIIHTGNPVRKDILNLEGKRTEGFRMFEINTPGPVILMIGGSQGALSVNRAISNMLQAFPENKVHLIWQTGESYAETARADLTALSRSFPAAKEFIHIRRFIRRMDLAYASADMVVSRAGAIAISELCVAGKPCILVPLPHAAEDHQTRNAEELVKKQAAILIPDNKLGECLQDQMFRLIRDEQRMKNMRKEISAMAVRDASEKIANEIIDLIRNEQA